MKTPTSCVAALFAVLLVPVAPLHAADAAKGEGLFDRQCANCHRGGVRFLKTTPEALANTLAPASPIRPHRFQLSEPQIDDLREYLRQSSKPSGSP